MSETYHGIARKQLDELDPEARWKEIQPKIKARATEIDPATFVSWFTFGSNGDPYGVGYEGADDIGRVWWVTNPDDNGSAVTAWDALDAHPELTMEEIYAREERWSRDADRFHGVFH
jgi:hypothetical protein